MCREMTEKEKVDCYMEFFKEYLKRFDGRRIFEWKFNIAFWTAILLFAGLMLKGVIKPEALPSFEVIFKGHVFVFAIYVFLWSGCLHRANAYDKSYGFEYKKAVEEFILNDSVTLVKVEEPKKKYFGPLLRWAPLSEIMITVLLLIFSLLIVKS